ncbi:helix-turn-helix domain-containing protein [Bradyrhizobium sp. WYCCWR 13023]|uniref:Helix-turn-helix domain-containing protein n=1 Tax=Bradyrhizobium zhengyangense TaxID=2911009 RepID=A0A9X1R681_9BRAD|nr:helix-turn-helix domain-containing protein [Bradyrhizobium zhengyangense]MCG2628297.1 helix-turn-helix domain-containing protein [Bradyrhizobium zhengyangense]
MLQLRSKSRSKKGRGRPTVYRAEFAEQAKKLCELGATEFDLAGFFKVSVPTIWRWRTSIPEFCNAVGAGKYKSDDRVEMSLYHRAVGYSFHTEKVFQHQGQIVRAPIIEHVPPDVGAAALWLKNRRPQQWRDRQEEVRIDVHMSLAELVNLSYRSDLPELPPAKAAVAEEA